MTEDELNDKIDAWHDVSPHPVLHEYLGWSWNEFAHWVRTGEQPDREERTA